MFQNFKFLIVAAATAGLSCRSKALLTEHPVHQTNKNRAAICNRCTSYIRYFRFISVRLGCQELSRGRYMARLQAKGL